jgi:hypothetical protein
LGGSQGDDFAHIRFGAVFRELVPSAAEAGFHGNRLSIALLLPITRQRRANPEDFENETGIKVRAVYDTEETNSTAR